MPHILRKSGFLVYPILIMIFILVFILGLVIPINKYIILFNLERFIFDSYFEWIGIIG